MMPGLLRTAGRRFRNYVLPLVGFWDLIARLDQVHARLIEIDVGLTARLGDLEGRYAARLDQVHARLIEIDAGLTACLGARLAEHEKRLICVVNSEVDRLDGFLVHHVAKLSAEIAATRIELRTRLPPVRV